MENYTLTTKNATMRMNLEDIMLSEVSQTQKDNYYMILFIGGTENSPIYRESKMVVARVWGEGKTGVTV